MSGPTTGSAETLAEALAKHLPSYQADGDYGEVQWIECSCGSEYFVDTDADEATHRAHVAEALLASDWMKRHDAEVRAEALREAADAALRMFDPPVPECIEWSEWLRARADNPALNEGGDQ